MILHENEIVMAILGMGTLIFIFLNYHQVKRLPSSLTLLSSFYLLLAAWLLTVLEGIFWGEVFNFLEHLFYAVSSVLLLVWCYQTLHSKDRFLG